MNPFSVSDIVRNALLEDQGPGDLTSTLIIPPALSGKARIMTHDFIVVSGLEAAAETFRQVDMRIIFTPLVKDGQRLKADEPVARLEGPAAAILTAERVALNFLARLSGVATMTARYVDAADNHSVNVLDTRKTTPGLRILEKAAVRHGGGRNGRFALFDGIMIKHNHIAAAGSLAEAVHRARSRSPRTIKVEVEVNSLEHLREALDTEADIIRLKHLTSAQLLKAVKMAEDRYAPGPRRVQLEAYGGVTLGNIHDIAATGVDAISTGEITSAAASADLCLQWD